MVGKKYLFQARGQNFAVGPRTWIMGVLNVTPDSFFDGGNYEDKNKAVDRALELEAQSADMIDIGGESTRPGSEPVPADVELGRIIPVIEALRKRTSCLISVDTVKARVAEAALEAGADIINDISSARHDIRMLELAHRFKAGLIMMHMKGEPKNMQDKPSYDNVLAEVKVFLKERLDYALAFGIPKERIIIDPGIGFGKRLEDNLRIINNLTTFQDLGRPVLVGTSRKSFIGKILDLPPEERLEGTIASAVLSIVRGAAILRVHDVKAVKRAVVVAEAILNEAQDASSFVGNTSRYVH